MPIEVFTPNSVSSREPPVFSKDQDPIFEAFQARLIVSESGYSYKETTILRKKSFHLYEQAKFNAGLSSASLNAAEIARLHQAADELIESIGNPIDTTPRELSESSQFLYQMIMGELPSFWQILKNFDLFIAVILKRNPAFDADAKKMLQGQLDKVYEYMNTGVHDHQGVEVFLMNLLSLYPFFAPKDGETLNVPQVIDGRVEKVKCQVHKIQLTPDWMGSPIYAIGLTPVDNPKAAPYVLFKGTTYPSDDGALLSILADISPFASVGKWIMKAGEGNLEAWLKQQPNKVIATGMSLGGAEAQHLGAMFPQYIRDVYALVPTNLWFNDVSDVNQLPPDQIPRVKKFYHDSDIVHLTGTHEIKGTKTYKLYDSVGRNPLLSHMRAFSADSEHVIVKVDNVQDQDSTTRKVLTVVHAILAVPLFLISLVFWSLVQLVRLLLEGIEAVIGSTDTHQERR